MTHLLSKHDVVRSFIRVDKSRDRFDGRRHGCGCLRHQLGLFLMLDQGVACVLYALEEVLLSAANSEPTVGMYPSTTLKRSCDQRGHAQLTIIPCSRFCSLVRHFLRVSSAFVDHRESWLCGSNSRTKSTRRSCGENHKQQLTLSE